MTSDGIRIQNVWNPVREPMQNADGWTIDGSVTARFQLVNGGAFGDFIGADFRRAATVNYAYDSRAGELTITALDEQGPHAIFDLKAKDVISVDRSSRSPGGDSIVASSASGQEPSDLPPAQPFSLAVNEQFDGQQRVLSALATGLPAHLELVVGCDRVIDESSGAGRSIQRVGYRFSSDFDLTLEVAITGTDTTERSAQVSLADRSGGMSRFGKSTENVVTVSQDAFVGTVKVSAGGAGLDSILLTDRSRGGLAQSFGGEFRLRFEATGTPLQNFRSTTGSQVL